MVYRRKRSTTTRRRTRRRIARPMRSLRMVSASSTFYVSQKSFLTQWAFSSASTPGFWRYLDILPGQMFNFTQHAAVFDEFKITRLTFEFRPNYESYDASNALNMYGAIHTIVDPSSSTVPSGAFGTAALNTFLEQGKTKSVRFGSVVTRSFRPKVSSQVTGGGLSGRLVSAPWLKTDDVSVNHRGMHVYLQSFDSTVNPIKYDIFVTYSILFRGHR